MSKQLAKTGLFMAIFLVFGLKNALSQPYYTVKFPDDLTLNQCNAAAPYTPPVITNEQCNVGVGISHSDEIYTVVPDACAKIVRTWTLLYWCDYLTSYSPTLILNPANTDLGPTVQGNAANHGYLKYVQVIKILDTGDPVMPPCPPDLTFCDYSPNDPSKYNHFGHDLCEGAVELSTKAWDKCSGSNLNFKYLLFLDLNSDGVFDSTMVSGVGNAFPISITTDVDTAFASIDFPPGFELPYGKHKVKWVAKDGCGHETACGQFFTIKDCKNPTIACISGLSINLMQVSGMATLWASDFLLYASDNCTPSNLLDIGIRKSGSGTGFTTANSVDLTCDDLGIVGIEIWAQDAAGNADFCLTYVFVTATGLPNPCMNAPLKLAGQVQKTDGQALEFVKMTLTGGQLPADGTAVLTSQTGQYAFPNQPQTGPWLLKPSLAGDFKTGISLADAERLKQHLLGFQPLNDPFLMLAADADGSGNLDWNDFQLIRQLANGIISDLPGSPSAWRFVCKNFVFTNPANPWAAPIPSSETPAGPGLWQADFIGFKMGDLVVSNDTLAAVNPNTVGIQSVENEGVSSVLASPNPFSDETILSFFLPTAGEVELAVFDIFGKKISGQIARFAAGENQFLLDENDCPSSGLFFVKLKTSGGEAIQRVVRF